ncbi:MAG: hypothetical protein M0R40_10295 [Firmicutes bacterium]|nr:hypothetical protein [Bacillota bacterium]
MTWQDKALRLWLDNTSWKVIVDLLTSEYPGAHLNRDRIRDYIRCTQEYKDKQKQKYIDKKEPKDTDIDEYIQAMYELQEKQERLDTKQVKATFRVPENKPVAIALWGDWHVGASGVDYKRLDKDTDTIGNTEGLYWVGMGDYKDNYQSFGHIGAQYEQVIQPGMQDRAVLHRLKDVSENNIALIRGCHDDWDYKTTNKDFISTMCAVTGAFNLWHGGDLTIEAGTQKYHFKLRHKYKFESSLNVENSMRRIMEIQGACDVAGAAHLHNPYYIERHLMGEFRVMCRTGSYKIWDEFGQKLAGYKGKPGIPTIILYPDKHRMIPLFLDDAVTVLRGLRL